MRNTVGSLFTGFSSALTVGSARLLNVTVPQMLLYLFHSNVSLSHTSLENVVLAGQGSLATVSTQSSLDLSTCVLVDISASEHGLISLYKSSLFISDSVVANVNVSLIIAQYSWISIKYTDISEILLDGNVLLIANGGLLNCLNCPSIVLSSVSCRNVSANRGAVVYAQASASNMSVSAVVEKSIFENCLARTSGGAFHTENTDLTISLSIFRGNSAKNGAAVYFHGSSQPFIISNCSFVRNMAQIAGSCIWWDGLKPLITSNTYLNNSAFYGNPQASTPHHLLLLNPDSLLPVTQFPVHGVTGQKMSQPLLVGVFDALGQLIVSENGTLVTAALPSGLKVVGSQEVMTEVGVAGFTFVLSPFSTETFNFTFSSVSIAPLTFEYGFRDCQPGEVRSPSGCFPCAKNSYSLDPADVLCRMCPANVKCHGRAELELDSEYWRANNLTDVLYPCLVLDSCIGGVSSACAAGYRGVLCNACTEGYYRYASWQCRSCEDEVHPVARGVLVAMWVIGTAAVPPQLFLRSQGPLYRFALAVRSFLNFAQVILFVSLLHAKWGFSTLVYNEVMRVVGSLGGLLIHGGCQNQDISQPYFQALVLSCYPVLLLLACALFWFLAKFKHERKEMLVAIASASCVAVYSYLPVLVLVVVTMHQCQEVEGTSWLVADMTEQCWSGEHLCYTLAITIPLLIFVVNGYCFAVLCILKPPKSLVCERFHKYLTAEYREEMKHWEVYQILRKLALAGLSLAYSKLQTFSSSIFLVCILGFSIQSDIKWAPYKFPVLAKMYLCAYLCAIVILYSIIDLHERGVTLVASIGTAIILGHIGVFTVRKNYYQVTMVASKEGFAAVEEQRRPVISVLEDSQEELNPPPSLQYLSEVSKDPGLSLAAAPGL